MGPYCQFCSNRCFVPLPARTPQHILTAYGSTTIIATCTKGQEFERKTVGYCYADIVQLQTKEFDPTSAIVDHGDETLSVEEGGQQIAELPKESVQSMQVKPLISAASQPPGGLPQEALDLLGQFRARRPKAFRLRWRGTNIPRGASVIINQQPHMIAMTQNGMVVAANGKDLGNYIRESESNGIQSMIIATEGDVCAGPN
jgi:hypothetical protein